MTVRVKACIKAIEVLSVPFIMSTLTVLQWNLRSLEGNKESSLKDLIEEYSADVVLLSETWLKDDISFEIPKYSIFRGDRPGPKRGGGVVVAVRDDWRCEMVSECNKDDFHCLIVNIDTPYWKKINFGSVYISQKGISEGIKETDKILEKPNELYLNEDGKKMMFIGGDFNVHHESWSRAPKGNNYGKDLLEIFEQHSLQVLNTKKPTRRSYSPDVTVISRECLRKEFIINWRVHPEECGSDHRPIITKIALYDNTKRPDKQLENNFSGPRFGKQLKQSKIMNLPGWRLTRSPK